MKYNTLIIDTSNLFWRVSVSHIKESLSKNESIDYSHHILYVIEKLKNLIDEFAYQDSKVFLLFDNPTSAYEIRRIISKGKYKHTRENKNISKKIYHILDIFEEIAKIYSDYFYVVKSDNHEADDLTRIIANEHKKDKILCISADLDWARNITSTCHWFNWVTVYDPKVFNEVYGFNPVGQSIQIYKAIHGDAADSIDNALPYLPKKYLLDIVNNCNTIKETLNYVIENLPDVWIVKFKDAYSKIVENYNLVQFYETSISYDSIVKKGETNIQKLKRFYIYLGFPLESRMIEMDKNQLFEDRKYI